MSVSKESSDDQLMAAIAQGSSMGFQILFDRHAGKGLGYARRLVGETATAEDLLQETWIKIVRLAPSYSGDGHFIAWFFTLIRNASLNFIRNQKRLVFKDHVAEIASDENPERRCLEDERVRILERELGALPETQKVALLLWAVEDLSYDDIARELNVSVSAVKSLIFRARKHLEGARD